MSEPSQSRYVWIALTVIALGIATVYLVFDFSGGATGIRWLAERVVHGVCWVFLGLAAFTKSRLAPIPEKLAGPFAMFAGACYIAYLVSFFIPEA
jgi:peptidoglycan/LPS O-acetylase OafA/YrhL